MTATALVLAARVRDLARGRWLLAYTLTFLGLAQGILWFAGAGPQAMLSLLNVTLLLVPLVALVFGVIHVHASRAFIELLLAQPIGRRGLFAGLWLGFALPLAGGFLAGTGVPLLLHRVPREVGWGAVLLLLGAGTALASAGAAAAFAIALRVDDRLRAVGLAVGAWLAATVLYDGLVLALVAAFGAYPLERPLLGLMLLNPVDLARVLVLLRLDVAALLGYTGALFRHAFGDGIGLVVALGVLAAWIAAPWAIARRRFLRRDF